MKYTDIPRSCPHGHTEDDLKSSGLDWDKFQKWMDGQTTSICDGIDFDPETSRRHKTVCFGKCHGTIYYDSDVRRFLQLGSFRRK